MLRRNHPERAGRPRMLLAYADGAYASECGRYFRRLGWEVQMVTSGAEAQALADRCRPDVIVYDAQLPDDNAWLTGADFAVVAIADDQDAAELPNSDFVIHRADGPAAIADCVLGEAHLGEAIYASHGPK